MRFRSKYTLLSVLAIAAFLATACGSSANQAAVATAVAMTVQAQHTQEALSTPSPFTLPSPGSPLLASPTASVTRAPPTPPPAGSNDTASCLQANYVADVTIPDGTIVSPGASFWKTWRVLNSGTCSWDSTYKFVFYDGDIMGGGYVYAFPGAAAPGETVDIPIQLFAPSAEGTYAGKWMIQSPNGTIFGVGQYNQPLTVEIVVGSGTPGKHTETVFNVTNVTYQVARRCTAANTFWTVTASITSNGPIKVTFTWIQSDGNNKANNKLTFTQASTLSANREWSQGVASSHNPRWVQVIITSPTYQEYAKSPPLLLCGD